MMDQFSTIGVELRRGYSLLCRWRIAGCLGGVMVAAVFAATVTPTGQASTILPISPRPVFSWEASDHGNDGNSHLPNGLPSTVQALNTLAVQKTASQNFVQPAEMDAGQTTPREFKLRRWRTDRAVIVSTVYEAGWLIADGITTVRIHGGAVEAGSAWAYGKHPRAGRVSAMMAAEFMGVEASSYLLHKMRAPRWIYIAPMMGSGSYHASGAIDNIRTGQ